MFNFIMANDIVQFDYEFITIMVTVPDRILSMREDDVEKPFSLTKPYGAIDLYFL